MSPSAWRAAVPGRRATPEAPPTAADGVSAGGRLLVGTSGFAYPAWSPRFYPTGIRPDRFLAHYATVFPACELNNTFYQQPSETKVRSWLDATPDHFRFAVKAQRGSSMRAFLRDPVASMDWLTGPYRRFGERLGTVLFRIPEQTARDDERLRALLAAWPPDLPFALEAQHPSWIADETFAILRDNGAVMVATELPEDTEPPILRVTGPFLYLRLRRHEYGQADLATWADRLVPFLDAGRDAFVFFRHDETGRATEFASGLAAAVDDARARVEG
jgi:uncharacterized protein YecE (DUF72 family)